MALTDTFARQVKSIRPAGDKHAGGCGMYPKEVMTGHGFRAITKTIMDEVLGERIDLIERQLAHVVKDPNGRAYNRTSQLPARREMMQRWAEYLDRLRVGADVISLHAKN